MFSNNFGYSRRGVSNSIASPGVSQIFGGNTSTGKFNCFRNQKSSVDIQSQNSNVKSSLDKEMKRYTQTYSSKVSSYKAMMNDSNKELMKKKERKKLKRRLKAKRVSVIYPDDRNVRVSNCIKTIDKEHAVYILQKNYKNYQGTAAIKTLKSTGTSIEDYGRRTQSTCNGDKIKAFDEPAVSSYSATKDFKREVVKVKDPDCPHCINASLISKKKQRKINEKEEIIAFEQQRLAAMKASEEAESTWRKNQQDVIKQEMNSTLSELYTKRYNQWQAKKNNKENFLQSQALQEETKQLINEAINQQAISTFEYKKDLDNQLNEIVDLRKQDRVKDIELEKNLKGLQFECYQRDLSIKQQNKETGEFLKSQITMENRQKQQEKEDFIKPPEVFYTDKELLELRKEAEESIKDIKIHMANFAQDQLHQHLSKIHKNKKQKECEINEGELINQRMKELLEQEKLAKKRTKDAYNKEMNSKLSEINEKKRKEWEMKKNDSTNKLQTEEMKQQYYELVKQAVEEQHKMKQSYYQDLLCQSANKKASLSQQRSKERQEEIDSKGFKFEFYSREPKMKEEIRNTGKFQKIQQEVNKMKIKQENEVSAMPPPSIMTVEELKLLKQEALNNEIEQRSVLNSLMKTQYQESIVQKKAKIVEEKRK